METLSYIGAAQRLGTTIEEVKVLVKQKKLKEVNPGQISKDSVYAFSGINPSGKQTKGTPGRKPSVMSIDDAADFLSVSIAKIKQLVEEGELEIVEGAKGVRGVREAMVKMYKKKMDGREEKVTPDENKEEPKREQSVEEVETGEDAPDTGADTERSGSCDEAACNDDTEDAGESHKNKENEGFSLDALMEELFPGIQRLPDFVRKAALAQKEEKRYSKDEMREAVDIAYMRGRLSVYDSLHSFERRN